MKHFIATRFNIKVEQWKTTKEGSQVLTEKWLEDRFALFERYCYPSVVNQKCKYFYWIIFFDIDTPTNFRDRIEKFLANNHNFKVLYIDGMKVLKDSFKQFITENLNDKDDFIITSRLDNDDAIHQDFVETIQNLAIRKHGTVIDLRKGFQMDITGSNNEMRKCSNKFGSFISLVESTECFNTVLSKNHLDWENSDSIVIHSRTRLWIEIIHSSNMVNQTKINMPLIKKVGLKNFGIQEVLNERSYISIVGNNLKIVLKKINRKIKRAFALFNR